MDDHSVKCDHNYEPFGNGLLVGEFILTNYKLVFKPTILRNYMADPASWKGSIQEKMAKYFIVELGNLYRAEVKTTVEKNNQIKNCYIEIVTKDCRSF